MSLQGMQQLVGQLAGLPLQYGSLTQSAYQPFFNYAGSQANNMAGLGQSYLRDTGAIGQGGMNLYGSLANNQAQMYTSELPFQMEQQQFNSIAPVLSGLLGSFGYNVPDLSPISMSYNRPDIMSGYGSAVQGAYGALNNAYDRSVQNAKYMDQPFMQMQADMMDRLPAAPFTQPTEPADPQGGGSQGAPQGGGSQGAPQGGPPQAPSYRPAQQPITNPFVPATNTNFKRVKTRHGEWRYA